MTRDIDVVVQLSEKDAMPFFKRFQGEYYVNNESIRRALDRKSMFNIVSLEHGGKVGCIIQGVTDFARTSFARRYKERVAGIEFWTTTREDVIIARMNSARESHSEMRIRDIANLTSSEYDAGYVDIWLDRLGLQVIWTEVEQWKIQHRQSND
jgi:hypothetical protein